MKSDLSFQPLLLIAAIGGLFGIVVNYFIHNIAQISQIDPLNLTIVIVLTLILISQFLKKLASR